MKIIKFSQSQVSYTAIVSTESIDNNAVTPWKTLIGSFDIPEGWKVHAHHMTMNMGKIKDTSLLGKKVNLNVTAIGQDENVIAVLVESPIATKNTHPHITIAVAPHAKPYQSNNLKTWNKIEHTFSLNGVIAEVMTDGTVSQKEEDVLENQ